MNKHFLKEIGGLRQAVAEEEAIIKEVLSAWLQDASEKMMAGKSGMGCTHNLPLRKVKAMVAGQKVTVNIAVRKGVSEIETRMEFTLLGNKYRTVTKGCSLKRPLSKLETELEKIPEIVAYCEAMELDESVPMACVKAGRKGGRL